MNLPRPVLLLVLVPFAAYSLYAVMQVGYIGIFTSHFHVAGMQVLVDLVIACLLLLVWMVRDARARGRTVWPFVVLTFATGSFGPLLYLLTQPTATAAGQAA